MGLRSPTWCFPNPASGRITVEDQSTGEFRFDPDPGWEGGAYDTFSWVVSDGHAILSSPGSDSQITDT